MIAHPCKDCGKPIRSDGIRCMPCWERYRSAHLKPSIIVTHGVEVRRILGNPCGPGEIHQMATYRPVGSAWEVRRRIVHEAAEASR